MYGYESAAAWIAVFQIGPFGWHRSELRRQAAQYEAHPGLVTRHAVDTDRPTILEAPSVDDVVSENSGRVLDFFPSANDGDKRDRQRRQVEAAWGIWLWLVADLIPDGGSCLTTVSPWPGSVLMHMT